MEKRTCNHTSETDTDVAARKCGFKNDQRRFGAYETQQEHNLALVTTHIWPFAEPCFHENNQ